MIDRAEMWGWIALFYNNWYRSIATFYFFRFRVIFSFKIVFNTKKYQIGIFWFQNQNVDIRWFDDQIWSVLDWYGFGGCWLMFVCIFRCIWDSKKKNFCNTFLHQFGIGFGFLVYLPDFFISWRYDFGKNIWLTILFGHIIWLTILFHHIF